MWEDENDPYARPAYQLPDMQVTARGPRGVGSMIGGMLGGGMGMGMRAAGKLGSRLRGAMGGAMGSARSVDYLDDLDMHMPEEAHMKQMPSRAGGGRALLDDELRQATGAAVTSDELRRMRKMFAEMQ